VMWLLLLLVLLKSTRITNTSSITCIPIITNTYVLRKKYNYMDFQ
jgi:hypothetical protein